MGVLLLDQLEDFVRAVHIVTPEVEWKVSDAIAAYITGLNRENGKETENGLKYEVFIQETHPQDKGSRVLKRRWGSYGYSREIVLPYQPEVYEGHADYCFDKGKAIWIYAEGGGLLHLAERFVNKLGSNDLPPYKKYPDEKSRVSIVTPFRDVNDGQVLGVLTIEGPYILEYSHGALEILRQLGHIISIFLRNEKETLLSSQNKRLAANRLLRWVKESGTFATLCQRPVVFQAHSHGAREDIVGIVANAVASVSVMHEEKNEIAVEHITWMDNASPQDIMSKLLVELRKSVAGIAYLSEPVEDLASSKFRDNPNVLYEAGIMHGLEMRLEMPFRGYLLIREDDSTSGFPFDVAQKRSVVVKRDRNGFILNRQVVEAQIRKGLIELLGLSAPDLG